MGKLEIVTYDCDKCGKELNTCNNAMNIRTTLCEDGYWSRLHVKIEHRHGVHNNGITEDADLCQKCAIKLLTDALKRVKSGERATAGTEHAEQGDWK